MSERVLTVGAVRDALRDVDALGGFFALSTDPAEAVDPSWRPLTRLGEVLGTRVDEVAAQLGGAERRVAASLLELSLSARFTALVIGAAVLHRVLPDLPHDALHWRPWSGGPLPLWIAEPGGRALGGDPGEAADAVTAAIADHLRPVVEALGEEGAVSPRVLWGNVASSVGGAVRVLVTERPAARENAEALARAVVAREPLAGLGEFVAAPGHPTGFGFARRSCCLFYRVPGGGTCGDCVLECRG